MLIYSAAQYTEARRGFEILGNILKQLGKLCLTKLAPLSYQTIYFVAYVMCGWVSESQ